MANGFQSDAFQTDAFQFDAASYAGSTSAGIRAASRRTDRQPRLTAAVEGRVITRSRRTIVTHTLTERQRSDKRLPYHDTTQPGAVLSAVQRISSGQRTQADPISIEEALETGIFQNVELWW